MAGEWQIAPLAELYEFSSGLSKPRSAFGTGYPFVSFKDIFYNIFVPKELAELVQSTEQDRDRCSVRRGDVFLTRTSETMDELGMSCVALRDIPNATFNGFTKRLRPKDDRRIAPEYAGYFFRSPDFRQAVTAMSSMSTRASLNNEMLARLSITLPPFGEQATIGHILGTLDDKIEVNRRMNETLEAMTRALFKSWFVDFDPVRAKAEGRDPCLPQHLADLFPDSFENSELGEIPRGWKVASIYEIADVIYGAPFASAKFNTEGLGLPLIRIRDLANESPAVWTTEAHPKGYVVRPGEIVVGMDGEFRAYLWGGAEGWLNQRVCVFVPKGGASAAFVRNSILEPLAHIESTETATTVIHLGKGDIDRFVTVIPTDDVLAIFSSNCQPWYSRIIAAKREARSLAALRDALLPKLVSGELRVRDAEKFIGRAA